jgi:hypothetical protein
MDNGDTILPAPTQLQCEWCGATAGGDGSKICTSLSDTDLLLHYHGASSQNCNRQTWLHRRDLFERKTPMLAKKSAA